jgi:hypothetical protein
MRRVPFLTLSLRGLKFVSFRVSDANADACHLPSLPRSILVSAIWFGAHEYSQAVDNEQNQSFPDFFSRPLKAITAQVDVLLITGHGVLPDPTYSKTNGRITNPAIAASVETLVITASGVLMHTFF